MRSSPHQATAHRAVSRHKILRSQLIIHSWSCGPRLNYEGFSHGLKTCHRHVFLTAFQIHPSPQHEKRTLSGRIRFFFMAEKEGFEPSIPFWGIHDFQSCALGQLRDFSISSSALGDLHIILPTSGFVNRYFENF